jgi:hypothetical protein
MRGPELDRLAARFDIRRDLWHRPVMSAPLPLRCFIQGWFRLTTCARACRQAERHGAGYASLAGQVTEETGRQPVTVPPMRGVDPEMRGWSFFQLLEHNVRVNWSITALTTQLARGESLHGAAALDPKHDVLPGDAPGPEQVAAHADSVQAHLDAVAQLPDLRGSARSPHPLFGPFDAHAWHCMFAFHLGLHLRQARHIVAEATARE